MAESYPFDKIQLKLIEAVLCEFFFIILLHGELRSITEVLLYPVQLSFSIWHLCE